MAWTFVRPQDPSVLDGRPLLDLGTGDGQTVLALTDGGLRVGVDRSPAALGAARRSGLRQVAVSSATALPFKTASFETVLAADLFHHADDPELVGLLAEIGRVLTAGGNLVAWWYEVGGRGGAGDPAFARTYAEITRFAVGFTTVEPLKLEFGLEPSPATVGMIATR